MAQFRRDSDPTPVPRKFQELMVDGKPDFEDLLTCVFGITESDAEVFRHLLAAEGATAEELARTIGCDRSTVNRRLDALQERELITRHRNLLSGGGVVYEYEPVSPDRMAELMHRTLDEWTAFMHEEIDDRVAAVDDRTSAA